MLFPMILAWITCARFFYKTEEEASKRDAGEENCYKPPNKLSFDPRVLELNQLSFPSQKYQWLGELRCVTPVNFVRDISTGLGFANFKVTPEKVNSRHLNSALYSHGNQMVIIVLSIRPLSLIMTAR